jgi:spermidine synthase
VALSGSSWLAEHSFQLLLSGCNNLMHGSKREIVSVAGRGAGNHARECCRHGGAEKWILLSEVPGGSPFDDLLLVQ